MEAIRIIREMRRATNETYPQFIVVENVPGALSSTGGRDFQRILSEITQADIPMPLHGKWANAGMVVCNGVTVEYRVIDAQFWAVPQRRRRLYLVGDFRNRCREQILFKPESLYRYLTPGGVPWERIAADSQSGAHSAIEVLNDQGGDSINSNKEELSPTLRSESHGNLPIITMPINMQLAARHQSLGNCTGFGIGENESPAYTLAAGKCHAVAMGVHQNQEGQLTTSGTAYTLSTAANASARNAPLIAVHPDICGTLCASAAGLSRPGGMASETDLCVVQPENGCLCAYGVDLQQVASKCNRSSLKDVQSVLCQTGTPCALISGEQTAHAIDCRNHRETEGISGTLQAKGGRGYSLNFLNPIRNGYIVRRLTPTECERLMHYKSGYTAFGHDGKPISDSMRYHMLGNSIVTSCAAYVLAGIVEQLLYNR